MSDTKRKGRLRDAARVWILALAWIGFTSAAARATWSLVTSSVPCEGTAEQNASGNWVLECTATAACSSGNCSVQNLPGSSTQTFCGCDSPAGPPSCCFVTLEVNAQGVPVPKVGGTCPFGSNCGWGRCGLVVKVLDGQIRVSAECIPFI
jgi:hypothetical protein